MNALKISSFKGGTLENDEHVPLIGLTATPADMVSRDTYDFFDCENGVPTSSFSYEDAVPQYLVPFKQYPALAHFQIDGIRSKDIPDEEKNRLLAEEGIEEYLEIKYLCFDGVEK